MGQNLKSSSSRRRCCPAAADLRDATHLSCSPNLNTTLDRSFRGNGNLWRLARQFPSGLKGREGRNHQPAIKGIFPRLNNVSAVRASADNVGRLDILDHSIAFAPREALAGCVTDCRRDGFLTAMDVSCWSFLDLI